MPELELSVVVPTRNEALNVVALVERLTAALREVQWELCVVDDSDDETPALLESMVAADPSHRRALLRSGAERQGGLSTAVVAGLHLARGRFVCVMDADLQHPPETIPAMLEAARAGADLVVASRYTAGGSEQGLDGLGRRAVSRGAAWLSRLIFAEARRSTDPLSGFFLCRRALIDGIEFRPVGFKILLELLVCVPGLVVRDVALSFAERQAGESKASLAQGLLFLRHLRSLFLEVRGSARLWKFALVGISGLVIFLASLGITGRVLALPALAAFVPAWLLSLGWNTALNRTWTFSDRRRRRGGTGPRRYLEGALLSGLLMFAVFALLTRRDLPLALAGLLSALAGMLANGITNVVTVRVGADTWARVATDQGITAALARLAAELHAERTYVLPARPIPSDAPGVPAEVLRRVVAGRRPALWTEAASHRGQRRSNIEETSMLLLPAVERDQVVAVVVCERRAPRGFDENAFDLAIRAVEALAPMVVAVARRTAAAAPAAATTTTAPAPAPPH